MGLPTLLWFCCGLGLLLQLVDAVFVALRPPAAPGAARQARPDRRGPGARGPATPTPRPTRRQDPGRHPMTDTGRHQPPLRLTRADLDALPNYVPGRSPADLARELGLAEAIKLASNEVPYGPLPGVVEAVAEAVAGSHRYPDMGVVALRERARRAVRRGRRPDRHRLRLGGAGRAPGPGHLPARRRDALLVAVVRGVPDHRGDQRRDQRAGAQRRRARPRPGRDGRRGDRPDPDGPGLQPEQPDRHRGPQAELDRFLDAVPTTCWSCIDEAYREFVTDPEVPDGLDLPATGPTWWCCAPCPRRGAWPGCGSATWSPPPEVAAAVRKVVTPFSTSMAAQAGGARRAGPGRRGASAAARWSSPSGTGSPRRCASCVPDVPSSQANFVWLPLGERAVRVRQGVRGARRDRAAVRRRRRPGHHRHPGRERRLPRRRRSTALVG